MSGPSTRSRSRLAVTATWLALTVIATPGRVVAQSATIDRLLQEREPVRWQVLYEGTATVGTRWFDGPRAPRVSSTAGGGVGIGLQRAIGPEVRGGVMLRALLQPVTLTEAGDSWTAGTLREVDVLALIDRVAGQRGSWQLLLSAAAGAAVVGGTPDVLPFAELGLLQPMGETGVILRRHQQDGSAPKRHLELLARVGVMRLAATGTRPLMTSGWSNRFTLGLRVTK